jgi:neurotransmitter:Na+ symporter, NSS family
VAFLEDELGWKRRKAVNVVFLFLVACVSLVVAFFKYGFLDELDFWAGTFGLALFAVIEIILFSWVFGVERGWVEMHKGADLKVPRVFKYVLKYITPVYLLAILATWTYQEAIDKLMMTHEDAARRPYLWAARALFAAVIAGTLLLVHYAWKRRRKASSLGDHA